MAQLSWKMCEVTPDPPKRKRKPTDHTKLILRSGRLTKAYWLLKEGLQQDVRPTFVKYANTPRGYYERSEKVLINALIGRGWMENRPGPRGGKDSYRTTGDGAFMVLVAEGRLAAMQERNDDRERTG